MSELKHPNCPFCGKPMYACGGNNSDLIRCASCQYIVTETINAKRPIEDALRAELDAAKRRIAELEAEVKRLTPKQKQIDKPSTWICTGKSPLIQYPNDNLPDEIFAKRFRAETTKGDGA